MFRKGLNIGKEKSIWKKQRYFLLFILILGGVFLLFAAGCGSSPNYYGGGDLAVPQAPREDAKMAYSTSVAYDNALPAEPASGELEGSAEKSSQQYIIRNAHLTLIITDIEEAAREIQQKTAQLQGYVSSMELYDLTQERKAGRISLRIPEEKFDLALDMLEEVGQIKNKNINEQDVTLQYIDLEARIATMEAQEERLRELLDRAEKVEEVLEVEKELWRVRGNLESMIAEFKHLQQRVSYSSIDIYLEEKDPLTTTLVENLGTGEKLMNLLALNTNRLFKGISGLIVVTIGSLPIIAPLVLLLLLFRKIVLTFKERKKTKIQDQKEKIVEG